MESLFRIWKVNRKIYLNLLNSFTLEQLNKIPTGFNNNLIWNIGHVVAVQQLLIYRASNLPMNVSQELVSRYKPGTKPEQDATQAEVDELKELLISLLSKTEEDYKNGIFTTYNEFSTSAGFQIATLSDAFEFNNYHEGMHLGVVLSLRKLV